MVRIVLADHDPAWADAFAEVGRHLRGVFGAAAPRIDHIGSTSVPGLAAKPVIDVQITVGSLAVVDGVVGHLEGLGFLPEPDNPDRRKRFLRRHAPAANLHVRPAGDFAQQAALLFRDFLRVDDDARGEYEATKRRLAEQDWPTVDDYADAKGDTVWAILRAADRWAWHGWYPGPSDA
jgi:GrpB-like predicted nucleotidyltransferase (UPF0157 family)